MKPRKLDETAYQATMTPKMMDVTATATGPDVWSYIEAIPTDDLCGHEVFDHFVEYVYRTSDDRFDHVLVMTKTKNVYLAVIVDLAADAVYGHLLGQNELYGLEAKH